MDRVGRKPLLCAGLALMAAAMVALALVIALLLPPSPSHAVALLHSGSISGALALGSIGVYVVGFEISLGPMLALLLTEIYPSQLRGRCVALGTAFAWVLNFATVLSFSYLQRAVGNGNVFYVYAATCATALAFVAMAVPETKGRSLEEVGRLLRGRG